MTFGERLRALRTMSNRTRTAVAAAVGVSESSVCRWEFDRCLPDAAKLGRLADALGCSTDDLLGRDGEEA